jgi:osmotically-inducible protein OsmY
MLTRKTDAQIQRDVIDELHWEPKTRDAEIAVATKDGVVTLAGKIPDFPKKFAAVRAAQRVAGVKAVADDLEVRLSMEVERTDTDIAHAAATALTWHVEVPARNIKLRVDEGWVTLEGSVEWQYQRDTAERAMRSLWGVKGVTNLIRVMPSAPSTTDVGRMIKDALRRSAEMDADRIVVKAADGRVTLSGSVRTWAERKDAERAAWSAPGVHEVVDNIAVTP